jgi:hypothetical protein
MKDLTLACVTLACVTPACDPGLRCLSQFQFIAATLRQFNIGDNRNSPRQYWLQASSRSAVAAHHPDQYIRINQHFLVWAIRIIRQITRVAKFAYMGRHIMHILTITPHAK